MVSVQAISPSFDVSSLRMIGHLPTRLTHSAAALYLSGLADHLVPIYGIGPRARHSLAGGFNRRMCISVVDDGQLVGILGIQTEGANFMDVSLSTLKPFYGIPGSLWRLGLLEFLHHTPMADEVHLDGVIVAPAYRRRGIGIAMITTLFSWAAGKGFSRVSLEVADTNTNARKLYRRLGFEAARQQIVWPIGSLLGFGTSTVMVKHLF